MKFTEEQIIAAARALSDRSARQCNVNKLDNWDIYGGDFIDDAREALEAAFVAAPVASAPTDHEFKNFHRSLCARFGYTHDERDWKRDQVSLEEHIAARIAPTASADAVVEARNQALEEAAQLLGTIVVERTAETKAIDPDDRLYYHLTGEFAYAIRALKSGVLRTGEGGDK